MSRATQFRLVAVLVVVGLLIWLAANVLLLFFLSVPVALVLRNACKWVGAMLYLPTNLALAVVLLV